MAFNNEFTQVENSWQPAGTSRPNNFTTQQTFTGNYTTNFPIQINAGNVSQVEGNNFYSASLATNNGFQVQGYDSGGTSAPLVCSLYNANQSSTLVFNRCNGTYASKTGILTNQQLGAVQFYGMKTTTTTPRFAGGWAWSATEDWGASNHGTQATVTTYRNSDGASRNSFIRNDGVWEPGYGIRFGTTGLSILSTYEEGTWTPGIRSTGATFTVNATETVGRYIRIGKLVYVEFAIELSASTTGTTTNIIFIQNLPYAPQLLGTKNNNRPVLAYEGFTIGSANGGLCALLVNGTEFGVNFVRDNTTMGVVNGGMFSGSGARISGGFSYQVA